MLGIVRKLLFYAPGAGVGRSHKKAERDLIFCGKNV